MDLNLRALVVVLGLSVPLLWLLRAPTTALAMRSADFKLRAVAWILLTLLLFVAHSIWVFFIGAAIVLAAVSHKDSNWPGLYFFLLFVAPPFRVIIEGFGEIRQFLEMDYLRLLSLVILVPQTVRLASNRQTPGLFRMPSDKYLLGYVALQLMVIAPISSTTHLLRSTVTLGIDVLLPYYAFSRGIDNWYKLQDALAAFVCAAAVMAILALFESFKGWLLYAAVPDALGFHWGYGHYLAREGALRATVSAGHSIVFGYLMMVALGLHTALRAFYPSARSWLLVLLLLGAGLIVSFSRGPWVGGAAMGAMILLSGPGAGSRLRKVAPVGTVLLAIGIVSPLGQKVIALLPFVGANDSGSVDYRRQLFDVSWDVIMLNPLLGSPYFLSSMEELRQGEHIIDLVNSYLTIGLSTGFVGLALFMAIFISSTGRIWWRLVRGKTPEGESPIARALVGTVVGALITIATVSSDLSVALVYWCLAGISAAYLRIASGEHVAPQPQRQTFRYVA